MTEPTDAELLAEWDRVSHIADAGQRRLACLRAVLAKWGVQPVPAGYALVPVEPTPEMLSVMWVPANSSLADAYSSLSDAYNAMLAAAPQPVAREPLTDEQIEALPLWKRFVGLWPETRREIVRTIERHHGIKGGQQ